MENYLICKCKHVSYADVEDALHREQRLESVEQAFDDVQKVTHCSTVCGGCHDKIMNVISQIMNR